ncbi:hypothetical protein INT48_007531 [Thamnidium elegans]|uniref:Ataxin-10 homolog n=1 Tax=Thamnidium elegans TaxID=101142 RepID=A0A8H7VWP1_9FUNG|nr:hypothetical protein INT48_007531 [Thamnidium elegans]
MTNNIIDHLLSYKNGQQTSTQLEKELEESIKTTLSNHQYRTELGANPNYWRYSNAAMEVLLKDSSEPCLINLIKLTRNVVAGELHNQNLAIQYGALYKIEDLLSLKMSSESDNSMILQVGTQAICNIITNNQIAIDFIWKIWMSNQQRGYIWSLILSKSNEGLIMSALVLIINCIRDNKIRCDLLVTSKIGKDILAAILGDIERLHGNEESKNFELGYTIFSELISFGHFKQLYTQIDDYSDKILISDHQTILLKFLDSKVHASKATFPHFIRREELLFLVEQFEIVAKDTITIILSIKQSTTDLQAEKVTNTYTAIILLLQMLNELFVLDEDHQHGIKQMLVQVDALSLVSDILGNLESIKLPPVQVENPLAGFNFLKRECVRLMGTLCYKDRAMQDKIREIGAIPVILCQFKIDDSNPYLREYATLTLRNVMENNLENQKLIEELQPEEIVQTKELDEMGITPELTEDGKVRIKRNQ